MLSSFIFKIDKELAGAPDKVLSAVLLIVAAGLVVVALKSDPAFKALALAWTVLP